MLKIGFVGCGDISGIYLKNISSLFSKQLQIAGICDLVREKAEKAAKDYNIPKIYNDMFELFSDPDIDIVLNLTRPYEHFNVSLEALKAGKHVYSEKPLGASLEEGKALVDFAKSHNLLIGGAPDTFLGAGIQTAKSLIDSGFIGEIVGASAFMVCRGHESWHPDPAFYYKFGGGPMMDMGPYYLSALVSLIGPIKSTTGMAKASFPQRTITSSPLNGTIVDVDVPTYITGLMNFHNGAIGSIFTTFDVYSAQVPRIEIYGSLGTLSVPDPNTFGGPVKLNLPSSGQFLEFPLINGYSENSRALGLADMARAIERSQTSFRASSDLTFHVLEVMESFTTSSNSKAFVEISSMPERPSSMELF